MFENDRNSSRTIRAPDEFFRSAMQFAAGTAGSAIDRLGRCGLEACLEFPRLIKINHANPAHDREF